MDFPLKSFFAKIVICVVYDLFSCIKFYMLIIPIT